MALVPIFGRDFDLNALPPRWRPVCPVCGTWLGREVTLDVMSTSEGGTFRLTCTNHDEAHAVGVCRHYGLSADALVGETLANVALKIWADPERVLAATAEWLFTYKLIGRASR